MSIVLILMLLPLSSLRAGSDGTVADLLTGRFQWVAGPALIGPEDRATNRSVAMKDPSVVFYNGRWHIYATLKPNPRPAMMEYLSFTDWNNANAAPRQVISLSDSYHCAPEVFYFRPQKKWYLIYQWDDKTPKTGFYGPAYSTLQDVSKPETLTRPVMLFPRKPANVEHWIDFWVICDDAHAYLFFTGDDGRFWRSRTALGDFPAGWSQPKLILQTGKDAFYEASHTYRLKGLDKFLTMVEAVGPEGRRYYKAYIADRLDGEWEPLATTWEKPFAAINNVRFAPGVAPWTDAISHGELLRDGYDETLTVNPAHLRFLFQGCSKAERAGKKYSQFPWRLGMLEADP